MKVIEMMIVIGSVCLASTPSDVFLALLLPWTVSYHVTNLDLEIQEIYTDRNFVTLLYKEKLVFVEFLHV